MTSNEHEIEIARLKAVCLQLEQELSSERSRAAEARRELEALTSGREQFWIESKRNAGPGWERLGSTGDVRLGVSCASLIGRQKCPCNQEWLKGHTRVVTPSGEVIWMMD